MSSGQTNKSKPWKVAWATLHPRWNVKFRPSQASVREHPYRLPAAIQNRMQEFEEAVGGGLMMGYGSRVLEGVMGDKAPPGAFGTPEERAARDIDAYMVAPWWHPHPLFTLGMLLIHAKRKGHTISWYSPKITAMWKRVHIITPEVDFDVGCLPHRFKLERLASSTDVGLTDIGVTRDRCVVSARHDEAVEKQQLIFSPMNPYERLRHPPRRRKYARRLGWPVVYADPADDTYFANFEERFPETPPAPR